MLDPTPANRALVNRGIAEAMGYAVHKDYGSDGQVFIERKSTNGSVWWQTIDYTIDLNACYEVCEERGWHVNQVWMVDDTTGKKSYDVSISEVPSSYQTGTDLRWLVAVAVWEAVKRGS